MNSFSDLIGQYGFPIVASFGMAYVIYYVWGWTTKEIGPVILETRTTLVALIDRIRVLENNVIRLETKISVASEMLNKK